MKRICEFNRRIQKYRETLYEAFTKDRRHRQMKRQVAYKQGYKIVICGKFYEVSDTKRIFTLWKSISYTDSTRGME